MTYSRQVNNLLQYYILHCHDPKRDIQKVAKKCLNRKDYQILGHRMQFDGFKDLSQKEISDKFNIPLRQVGETEARITGEVIQTLETQKQNNANKDPTANAYTHCPYCANSLSPETVDIRARGPPRLLDKDLYSFMKDEGDLWKSTERREPISERNLGRVINSLYSQSSHEVAKGYERDTGEHLTIPNRPINQVKDLYLVTERQIRNYAIYRRSLPCGPKTLGSLRSILKKNGLPAIRQE